MTTLDTSAAPAIGATPHMHAEERRIITALVENLSAAGFKPAAVWLEGSYLMANHSARPRLVEYHGAEPGEITRPLTLAEVLQVFEDYDLYAPTLHFTDQHKTTWGGKGVMLVPGNRCDLISDWHCGDAAFNGIVEQVADAAGEGVFQ